MINPEKERKRMERREACMCCHLKLQGSIFRKIKELYKKIFKWHIVKKYIGVVDGYKGIPASILFSVLHI